MCKPAMLISFSITIFLSFNLLAQIMCIEIEIFWRVQQTIARSYVMLNDNCEVVYVIVFFVA